MDRDTLEKEKLAAEIALLNQKWWTKPAYIAAFIPTVLGLITLGASFYSGLIESKYKLLKSMQSDIERGQNELLFNREFLEDQKKQLKNEKREYETEKRELNSRINKLRNDNRIASSLGHLEALEAKGERLTPRHDSYKIIIDRLKGKNTEILQKRLLDMADADDKIVFTGNVYNMLYHGTGNVEWKKKLFDISKTDKAIKSREFWEVYNGLYLKWKISDTIQIVEFISGLLDSQRLSQEEQRKVLKVLSHQINYSWVSLDDNLLTKLEKKHAYFTIFRIARESLLNDDLAYYEKTDFLDILGYLSPYAYLAVLSQYVLNHQVDVDLSSRIRGSLDPAKSYWLDVGKCAARMRTPIRLESGEWKKWAHSHSELIILVMEPDLSRWRDDPSRMKNLIEGY